MYMQIYTHAHKYMHIHVMWCICVTRNHAHGLNLLKLLKKQSCLTYHKSTGLKIDHVVVDVPSASSFPILIFVAAAAVDVSQRGDVYTSEVGTRMTKFQRKKFFASTRFMAWVGYSLGLDFYARSCDVICNVNM